MNRSSLFYNMLSIFYIIAGTFIMLLALIFGSEYYYIAVPAYLFGVLLLVASYQVDKYGEQNG